MGAATGLGGGAGGIIQIISPAGRLPSKVLSLKRGTKHGMWCGIEAEHGYYYFVGGISVSGLSRNVYSLFAPY